MLRFLTDKRPLRAPYATLTEFYREEFVKHHRCLQKQREYYSERAIESAEEALQRIVSKLDVLCSTRSGEELVSRLLRQFDSVTGLSAWSDPKKVH
jgi:hypothetical protein